MAAGNADLTNPTGAEVTWKLRYGGETGFTNNLYVPQTNQLDWDYSELQDQLVEHHLPLIRAVISTLAVVESLSIRKRGTPDAGSVFTRTIEESGLQPGNPAPAWLTWKFRQVPNNAERLIVSGTPTPFKFGRVQFMGVPAAAIFGEGGVVGIVDDLISLATALPNIPQITTGTPENDAFSLVMVRHAGNVLQAKANLLDLTQQGIGHQLTRE